MTAACYAELQTTTHFSFLRGASSCEDLFATAAELGLPALGIVDRNSLAGIVRAHEASKATGVRLVVGCRLDLADGASILVYPTDRAAYGRLCRLLTIGKGRAGKGACRLGWEDLEERAQGLFAILIADAADEGLRRRLVRLRAIFGERAHLALTLRRRPDDSRWLDDLAALARALKIPTVATNDVLFHVPERRILQDVLTCIREGVTIDAAGFRRERFADRHLKPPEEMLRLFARHPEAAARTMEIVAQCRFSLDELKYQYPEERSDPSLTPQQTLEHLAWEGLAWRYPQSAPEKVKDLIRHELALIGQLGYAPYFLTVHAIVQFARYRGILCQGRGSAANSAVCYALGITTIDPMFHDLLFERFVSQDRREPPDIDVDFEHERREEVIQWIYETYGRDRAALCATVARYRTRGAVREVGKALGLSEDVTALLASQVSGWSVEGVSPAQAAELNLDPEDWRLRLTLSLARELIGTPRHLSQHPGGFVLTRDRLDELVPVEPAAMADRQVIEWDKDDIDALGLMKVDVLGLGMLGCLRRAFDLLKAEKGVSLDLAAIPQEDPATYEMIRKADTIGVFQIESRAQMAMLPRLRPETFYDLVIEVAIVRPGPIQGDMVHPYLRRRERREPVSYPTEELRSVLEKTLGVPLFQEQAMRIAIVCAGFSPSEADQLRRSMATFKFTGGVSHFRDKLIAGMERNGYTRAFAEKIFAQIEGFGSYGFPESHAASFAHLAYASSWMKRHHPDVFCCALLNAQPMGFYAPAQIVRDAQAHDVEVRPMDVNRSRWDCTLEQVSDGRHAVRLGFRMAKGLANRDGARIVAARGEVPFAGVDDLWRRAGTPSAALEHLARADAFRESLNLGRREALWAIRALPQTPLPLFAAAGDPAPGPPVELTPMSDGSEVVEDYRTFGLSLRRHPVAFLREDLARRGISPASALTTARDGRRIEIAGLMLVRQQPGSASGVTFVTIEDETGHANLVVWPKLFERQRRIVMSAGMIAVRGRVQREGEVIHVVADRFTDLTDLLHSLGERDTAAPLGRKARDMFDPDPRPETLKVRTRDFR